MNSVQEIKSRLTKNIAIDHLNIMDDTGRHLRHQHYDGGGHFQITIVSIDFEGISLLDRHKIVYQALDGMVKNEIHALGLKTIATSEWINEKETESWQ
jgi:BolA family transcriptional regulator, general stress-responsive regulator